MLNMIKNETLKNILKSFGIFALYVIYFYLAHKILFFFTERGSLDSFHDTFFELIDFVIYIPIIIISLVYLYRYNRLKDNFKIDYRILFIPVLALLFRIVEDPIVQIDSIRNGFESNIKNIEKTSFSDLKFKFILIILIIPFTEELVFRKTIINYFNKPVLALFISSFLFTIIHGHNKIEIGYLTIIFLFGLILGVIYIKWGLLYSFVFHATYNLMFFFLRYYFSGDYYDVLKRMNFGFSYWLIFGLALLIMIIIFNNIFKNLK